MKRYLKVLTAIMTAGVISSASQIAINSVVYADTATSAETTSIDTRPHFDTEGYVVVNDLQFHKTSDTTVAVSKGMDFNESKINIPSSISIDDVRFTVTSIEDNAFKNTIEDDTRTYAATKIIIPSSIVRIGNYCFYDLVNVQYIDLSKLPNNGSGYGNARKQIPSNGSMSWYCLTMNPNAKLDRVKVSGTWYGIPYDSYGKRVEAVYDMI